ncbi:MAG: DNA polymerase III subunit alpha, partial [Candidatus Pacearchaeota archaeon]
QRRGIKLDIDKIPLDDPNTFALLRKANVLGVFQLDSSSGIRDLFAKAQVQKFEEIAALLALYRPGPMGSGMLDDYLERKSGRKKVVYPHPSLEEILKETDGVVVYQEQVMGISRVLGGFSVGDSDVLRKAMAKKDKKKLPELKEKFVKGAVANGHNEKFATELFEQLEKFGEYGFNKSHSVAYAFVTYQTAYLKANYTIEYMTALLAGDHGRTTDIVKYINNCKEMGIKVLGPDIKDSGVSFKILDEESIRFGLSSVKGVGEVPAESIVQTRQKLNNFLTLEDFLKNVELKHLNRKLLEALIYAGAFDSFGYTRKCLYENLDSLISYAQEEQKRKQEGVIGLFGEDTSYTLHLPKQAEEWELEEKLKFEKSVSGVFLTGHPLDKYKKYLKTLSYSTIETIEEMSSGAKVDFCGVITKIEVRYNKKNEEFVNFKVEDYTGEIDCTLFHKNYLKYKDLLKEDQILFLSGNLDKIEVGEAEVKGQILVNSVEILNDEILEKKLEKSLHILLYSDLDPSIINRLYAVLTSFKGKSSVFFHLKTNGQNEKKVIKAHPHYNVEPNKELFYQLKSILGPNSIFYSVGEEMRKVS